MALQTILRFDVLLNMLLAPEFKTVSTISKQESPLLGRNCTAELGRTMDSVGLRRLCHGLEISEIFLTGALLFSTVDLSGSSTSGMRAPNATSAALPA